MEFGAGEDVGDAGDGLGDFGEEVLMVNDGLGLLLAIASKF